jgi:hypothetical protein
MVFGVLWGAKMMYYLAGGVIVLLSIRVLIGLYRNRDRVPTSWSAWQHRISDLWKQIPGAPLRVKVLHGLMCPFTVADDAARW